VSRLFVFDFDGVLFRTERECLAIAYHAARELPAAWAAPYRERAEPSPEVERSFLAHRHWVGPPWQYAVLLRAIASGALPATTEQFLAIAAAQRVELESFTERYFAARGALAEDRARWLALAAPIPEACRELKRLHARGVAAILSTRDDRSIRSLCEHHLGLALGPGELLPRSGPREKWEILLEVAAARGLAPGDVFFLDDYLPHALPARRRGVAAYLAGWGYLGGGDVEAALTAGVPCLQLPELGAALAALEAVHEASNETIHEENRT
jgi:phosphoglycolate phosphatase-like HAD superfamily hydrolase